MSEFTQDKDERGEFTRKKAEKAFLYRAQNNTREAELYVETMRAKKNYEGKRDSYFLTEKGTVAERQAKAEMMDEVQEAHNEYLMAILEHRRLKGELELAEMRFDGWRSANKANIGLEKRSL